MARFGSCLALCLSMLLSWHGVYSHGGHGGLSDEHHFTMTDGNPSEHNTDFDHEAFLGKGHGHDFDKYSPEQSKKRLRELVPRIDKDGNNFVTSEELRDWIEHQRTRYMWNNIDQVIGQMDTDKNKKLSWKEYKTSTYGDWIDESVMDKKLAERIKKDHYKFDQTDTNKDGELEVEEFVYFRHPEESKHMKQIAVDEVIDEVDKDGDRLISLKEFLGQYGEDDNAPDWVVDDRRHFADKLDKNKNGVLDREEVYTWVVPLEHETDNEVAHLIDGADDNGDGLLSTDEIVLHYQLFVGSTATDHGKSLKDEL